MVFTFTSLVFADKNYQAVNFVDIVETPSINDLPSGSPPSLTGNTLTLGYIPWLYAELEPEVYRFAGDWYFDLNGGGNSQDYLKTFDVFVTDQMDADWKVVTGSLTQGKKLYTTFWITRLDWNLVKNAGEKWWEVQNFKTYDASGNLLASGPNKNAHYKVFIDEVAPPVPEPISSALFLLGAGALGIKLYRRKKT